MVASGYSIAQMLLKDGDGFCVVKFGTGEEEIVHVQEASHLLTQPLVTTNTVPSAAVLTSVQPCHKADTVSGCSDMDDASVTAVYTGKFAWAKWSCYIRVPPLQNRIVLLCSVRHVQAISMLCMTYALNVLLNWLLLFLSARICHE